MFTGIITDIGEIVAREGGQFRVRSSYPAAGVALGASICHDGCCLTVTGVVAESQGSLYTLDVSNETLARSTLGDSRPGRRLNLERALKAGDELGGHIVTGHVDGVARIADIRSDRNSRRFTFEAPPELARYIASKGSVALDGTSLTVNEVNDLKFGVNLIPHTLAVTTWGERVVGDWVNIEVDLFARYLARLADVRSA